MNEQGHIQTVIHPVDDQILIGFAGPGFSQSIMVKLSSVLEAQQLGMEFFNSIVTAAETLYPHTTEEQCPNPQPSQLTEQTKS